MIKWCVSTTWNLIIPQDRPESASCLVFKKWSILSQHYDPNLLKINPFLRAIVFSGDHSWSIFWTSGRNTEVPFELHLKILGLYREAESSLVKKPHNLQWETKTWFSSLCWQYLPLAIHRRWRALQEKALSSLVAHPEVRTCFHGPSLLQRSCRRTSLAKAEIRLFQDWTHWGLADFQIIWHCFGMWATAPLRK